MTQQTTTSPASLIARRAAIASGAVTWPAPFAPSLARPALLPASRSTAFPVAVTWPLVARPARVVAAMTFVAWRTVVTSFGGPRPAASVMRPVMTWVFTCECEEWKRHKRRCYWRHKACCCATNVFSTTRTGKDGWDVGTRGRNCTGAGWLVCLAEDVRFANKTRGNVSRCLRLKQCSRDRKKSMQDYKAGRS